MTATIHNKMTPVSYEETLHDTQDAVLNKEFEGFEQDYLILHSLLRKYRPHSYFEIGTNMGTGLQVACAAIYPYHFEATIYSLDLPTELAHKSLQHPISEGKGDKVGQNCGFPYTQLRGDSLKFPFDDYPAECYFIDGEHDYQHVSHETRQALSQRPKLIIYHDADIPEVSTAILSAFKGHKNGRDYTIYRVTGTRIAYAR